jgi:Mn2+/Fe2+ NRAMP family transporter
MGLGLNYIGVSPIKALIYTAILYGITAPVIIGLILLISNNKKIMGKHTNSIAANVLGMMALLIMTAAALGFLYLFY